MPDGITGGKTIAVPLPVGTTLLRRIECGLPGVSESTKTKICRLLYKAYKDTQAYQTGVHCQVVQPEEIKGERKIPSNQAVPHPDDTDVQKGTIGPAGPPELRCYEIKLTNPARTAILDIALMMGCAWAYHVISVIKEVDAQPIPSGDEIYKVIEIKPDG